MSTAPVASTAALLLGRNLRISLGRRSVQQLIVSPLVFFVGFYAVSAKLLTARGVDFGQYLPPAIIVQSAAFGAISTAFLVAADRRSGLLNRCRVLPIPSAAIVLARLAADAVRVLIPITVLLVAGHLIGFRFHAGVLQAGAFVLLAVAFSLTISAGAAAIGFGSSEPEAIASMVFLPLLPMINISTVFVPAEVFPDWLEPVVRANPFSAVAQALRSLSGGTPGPVWPALAWIAVLGTLFGLSAARAFRKERP